MRILHISSLYHPDQIGGAEVMVSVLAETQAAKGHEVAVVCASRNEEPPFVENGVVVYRTGFGTPFFILDRPERSQFDWMRYKVAALLNGYAAKKVAAAIRHFRPDIVNSHSLSELPPQIWPIAKNFGASVVHTLHDYKSVCTKGTMFRNGEVCGAQHFKCRFLSYLHYRSQFSVDAVTGVGTEILQRHLDAGLFLRVPENLRRVIWNPIDPPSRVRNRVLVSGEDVVFGFLGRIEESKGADILLEACRKLPPGGWKLLFGGRAVDGLEKYRALAAGLPVDFLGFVNRDDFFDKIDCLVMPAIWPEPFGRTVAESYARGVPVIGSQIAGVEEQIGAQQIDWLFAPGDTTALARIMLALIGNRASLLERSPNMESLVARTTPVNVAESYLDLYRATASQSAGGGEGEV
jgi:glycogen synthase